MPVYIATLSSCDCTPIPDMCFRADDMISAVMECQGKVSAIYAKASEAKIELHDDISIVSITEADFELMDDVGIDCLVDFWKETVTK
jgi:hypothetical protein